MSVKYHSIFILVICESLTVGSDSGPFLPSAMQNETWITIENTINGLRNRFSSQRQFQAANMHVVRYSAKLEKSAQKHLNDIGKNPVDDKSRPLGETVIDQVSLMKPQSFVQLHVRQWYLLGKYCPKKGFFDSTLIKHKECKDFTQLIWAETRYVGCALGVRYTDLFQRLVCHYYPKGSTGITYKHGRPCSMCGTDICNTVYTALCGYGEAAGSKSASNNDFF